MEAKQERERRRQRRRQRQQQSTQPLEDATIGLAGASGIGLGTGFAIGTPAAAAAGHQYGERIGQEVGLWLINNLNFAVAYFGVLGLANLLNGIDLIVTNGISEVKIQKLIRSQIRKSENQIFQDFTSVYNSTVYADFANLESESGVFRSTVDAFGGMGALFGFAAGVPAGAAVGASCKRRCASGWRKDKEEGPNGGVVVVDRKACGHWPPRGPRDLHVDGHLDRHRYGDGHRRGGRDFWGMGAFERGWLQDGPLLVVKYMAKAFGVFQQVYGQAVVNQIEQAIFDSSAIRINLTYTPSCDYFNYTYPVKDISFYVGNLSTCDFATGKNEKDKKTGASGAAAASGEETETLPT